MKSLVGTLIESEKFLICAIVNEVGSGEHPVADPVNLEYFAVGYVRECLAKALPLLKPDAKAEAEAIIAQLAK